MNTAKQMLLQEGTVIPAHPLAIDAALKLNEKRQRGLTRYYLSAGCGGVAVGVHTTQFEIRKPEFGLLEPVLKLAAEEIEAAALTRPFLKVAGICGSQDQALAEADLALKYGYDLGLLSMGGLQDWSEKQLLKRAEKIAEKIPVFGFYLQPAVGGRVLSYDFWKDFADLPNVLAIKVAAFNRYQTLDVARAVCHSSRRLDIALYTGNDDNIVADLITPYRFHVNGQWIEKRFVGGLLGHWAVCTRSAVRLMEEVRSFLQNKNSDAASMLARGVEVTDMNAAVFDVQHGFKGCIAGIQYVLQKQGLLDGLWCLSPEEVLSAGQKEEIDRVLHQYPHFSKGEMA